MGNIAFIAPYPDLAALAGELCDHKYPDVSVYEGLLEEGLSCAQKAIAAGHRVIVSRGGTANLIRQHVGVPVVEVRVTGYDILRVFSEFIDSNKTIGVIGYRNVVEGCRAVSNMLGMPLREMMTLSSNETPDWQSAQAFLREQLAKAPVDVVVGDTLVVSRLKLSGPEVRLILSGTEAIFEAIEEARRIAKVQAEEKKAAEQFRAVLNFIHDGVLAVDASGNINVINPSAEKIFQTTAAKVIGRPVRDVIPNTGMIDVLRSGSAHFAQLQNTPSGMIVTNRVPIEVDGRVQGVVATFQEAGRIQKTEQKIRAKLYAKGLFAKYSFSDILAWDTEMRLAVDRAKKYALSDGTVLIQGESGCGKELFAQSIHQASSRHGGPFVAINCSALPTQLLESELFGYVEGAFTGARKEGKPGLVELAHGGTLFLDEIGDMELSLQARLLRVLEERQVMRLGSDTWIPVDIRILAATNVPLKQRAFDGKFRMDLFYRLNVLALAIPALRYRKQDILPLAENFLQAAASKHQQPLPELTEQAKELLLRHAWPGNVRELRNTMERLTLIHEENQKIADILNGFLNDNENAAGCWQHQDERIPDKDDSLSQKMKDMKRLHAQNTLAACGGNKTKTARALGITRYTLDRLLG